MIEKMTQTEQVRWYMQEYGSIDPMQAMRDLGIYRLGARIWDLKNIENLNISKRNKSVKNRFGKNTVVAEYYLEDNHA